MNNKTDLPVCVCVLEACSSAHWNTQTDILLNNNSLNHEKETQRPTEHKKPGNKVYLHVAIRHLKVIGEKLKEKKRDVTQCSSYLSFFSTRLMEL